MNLKKYKKNKCIIIWCTGIFCNLVILNCKSKVTCGFSFVMYFARTFIVHIKAQCKPNTCLGNGNLEFASDHPRILLYMSILNLICIICSYFNVTSPGH